MENRFVTARALVAEDPIVVSGMGGISSLGLTRETLNAIFAGQSGIGYLPAVAAKCETLIGGMVPNPEEYLKAFFPTTASRLGRRSTQLGILTLLAATEALMQAKLIASPEQKLPKELGEWTGAYIGTGVGSSDLIWQTGTDYDGLPDPTTPEYAGVNKRLRGKHLLTALKILPEAHVYSLPFGIRGLLAAVIKACATGAGSIRLAWTQIALGFADIMIAGGTEKLCPIDVKTFNWLGREGALSRRNGEPTKASRPFDAGADGFVPAEGSWVVVLERQSHAKARNAQVLAILSGFGETTDGTGSTDPEVDGQIRAMRMALAMSGASPNDIDLVVAHGTSTETGDPVELKAIKSVLGASRHFDICAPKSEAGHLLGAAGSFGAAVGIEAIQRQETPPTINLETPIPDLLICTQAHSHLEECYLSVPRQARRRRIGKVLSNSFGFGGQNVCLQFDAPEG